MQILFLAHRLPYPPDKGDKIRSWFELQELAKRHVVDLFCFYDYAEDARYVDHVRGICRTVYAEHLDPFRARIQAAGGLLRGHSLTLRYFYTNSMGRAIARAQRKNRYDLIFVFSSSMAQYVDDASAVPRVMDMVDVDSDKWRQFSKHMLPPKSWMWRREADALADYEVRIARTFSSTILCTPAEAKLLEARAPGTKIEVLGNCMDEDYWNPEAVTVPPEILALQPYVILTGSMDYFPNVDAAVYFWKECLPTLKSAVPGIKFVIAGRNPAAEVRKLAEDPAVIVTGAVADMRPYLKGAAAAVAPLRVARGIQNKLLEAIAMRVPVATSRKVAAALRPDMQDAIFVADDPLEFAEKVAHVVRECDPSRLSANREKLFRCFGTQSMSAELDAIVNHCLNRDARCVGNPQA